MIGTSISSCPTTKLLIGTTIHSFRYCEPPLKTVPITTCNLSAWCIVFFVDQNSFARPYNKPDCVSCETEFGFTRVMVRHSFSALELLVEFKIVNDESCIDESITNIVLRNRLHV